MSYLFRSLGTVIWLSVATTLMQDTLRHYLYKRLSGQNVDEVCRVRCCDVSSTAHCCCATQIIRRVRESLTYIGELEPSVRAKVILSYQDAIHVAMWFTCGVAVCALISSCFIKEKPLTK